MPSQLNQVHITPTEKVGSLLWLRSLWKTRGPLACYRTMSLFQCGGSDIEAGTSLGRKFSGL